MEKQQKSKSAQGKPRTAAIEGMAQPGKPRQPGDSGSDVRNPASAPGTGRDPLVHPGDEQDITPDVIAGQSQPSKPATRQHGESSDRPGSTQRVGGQGDAKP